MQPRSLPFLPLTTLSSPDLSFIRVFHRPVQIVFAKMRKEAPKPKFNRFKVLETEYFCENNLRGASFRIFAT